MSQIDFYHLQKQNLKDVLPILLTKSYNLGKRIIIKVCNEQQAEDLSSYLWTFNDESFLPHGTQKSGHSDKQPIWIGCSNESPNNAQYLFLVYGADIAPDILSQYERIFNIFDGNNSSDVENARVFWKNCKQAGHTVHYWQQNAQKKWEQKA